MGQGQSVRLCDGCLSLTFIALQRLEMGSDREGGCSPHQHHQGRKYRKGVLMFLLCGRGPRGMARTLCPGFCTSGKLGTGSLFSPAHFLQSLIFEPPLEALRKF